MSDWTYDSVNKKYSDWQTYNSNSWERGEENARMVIDGNQWEDVEVSYNDINEDDLVFNLMFKIVKTAQANGRELELGVAMNQSGTDKNTQEEQAFSKLISSIMLNSNSTAAISKSLDKVYVFGQSVIYLNQYRESQYNLNKSLEYTCIDDPRMAFFDCFALNDDKSDGAFCGLQKKIKFGTLSKSYKNLPISAKNDDEITVYDFWAKKSKQYNYVLLSNNQYKREDKITSSDVKSTDESKRLVKQSRCDYIVFYRFVEGIQQPVNKQSYDDVSMFPLLYHPGLSEYIEHKWESYPLGYHLKDAQKLLNYAMSTAATMIKNMSGDKYFFDKKELAESDYMQIDDIESKTGAITLNTLNYKREVGAPFPNTIMSIIQQASQFIEVIAGTYVGDDAAKIKAISGVALDKMYNRADLVQNMVITRHIEFVNKLGNMLKDWIPSIYYQNRTITTSAINGVVDNIEINKELNAGGVSIIENDVRRLKYNYNYKITASPSAEIKKQNTRMELMNLYEKDQTGQDYNNTKDLYIDTLDISNKDIIKRRLTTTIDPNLIKYGNDDITYDQYMAIKKQNSQMMAQQQMQAQQTQLQQQQLEMQKMQTEIALLQEKVKAESIKSQVEINNAQIRGYEAKTKRFKEVESAKSQNTDELSTIAQSLQTEKNANLEKAKIDAENLKTLAGTNNNND